jgi:hypothetical protein
VESTPGPSFLILAEMPDREALKADGRGYLLKKYKHTRNSGTRKSGDEWESESWDTELYPADSALDRLMKYHGLYRETIEHSGAVEIIRIRDERPEE